MHTEKYDVCCGTLWLVALGKVWFGFVLSGGAGCFAFGWGAEKEPKGWKRKTGRVIARVGHQLECCWIWECCQRDAVHLNNILNISLLDRREILPHQVPVLAPTRSANHIFVCDALLAAKAFCRCVRRQSLFLFPFSEQKGWEVSRVQFGKSRKYKSGLQCGKVKPSVPGPWLVIFFSLRQIHYRGVSPICRLREASTACCWYGKVVQPFVICVVWCICLWRRAAVPP